MGGCISRENAVIPPVVSKRRVERMGLISSKRRTEYARKEFTERDTEEEEKSVYEDVEDEGEEEEDNEPAWGSIVPVAEEDEGQGGSDRLSRRNVIQKDHMTIYYPNSIELVRETRLVITGSNTSRCFSIANLVEVDLMTSRVDIGLDRNPSVFQRIDRFCDVTGHWCLLGDIFDTTTGEETFEGLSAIVALRGTHLLVLDKIEHRTHKQDDPSNEYVKAMQRLVSTCTIAGMKVMVDGTSWIDRTRSGVEVKIKQDDNHAIRDIQSFCR